MQPTGNGDSWFNDAVIAAYAHLIQIAHMEEHPPTNIKPVQIVSPAVTFEDHGLAKLQGAGPLLMVAG